MRALALLALLGAGCLDLDSLEHLHEVDAEDDLGVGDLGVADFAATPFAWTEPTSAMASGEVRSLTFHAPSTLLAATATGGIWRSTDATSWSLSSGGLTAHAISQTAFDSSGAVFAATNDGVWSSSDDGVTWSRTTGQPPVLSLSAIVIDGATIYAASSGTVYRSTDAGASWVALEGSADMGVGPTAIHALVVNDSHTLCVAGNASHVFAYRDDAWLDISPPPPTAGQPAYGVFTVITTSMGSLFVGSTTGYVLHTASTFTPSWTKDLVPAFPAVAFEGQALATTSDGAVHFAMKGVGRWIIDGTTMFIGPTSSGDPLGALVDSLAGGAGGALYASGPFGVAAASPSTSALRVFDSGLYDSVVTALASQPKSANGVYAGTSLGLLVHTGNSGQSWTVGRLPASAAPGTIHALAAGPVTSAIAYAASETGVWKTTTSGTTWTQVIGPLAPVTGIAIAPKSESTVYAAGKDGIYTSKDAGSSWSAAHGPVAATALLVTTNGLYAASGTNAAADLELSADGGTTWTPLHEGLPGATVVSLAAATTGSTDVVFAATSTSGVYKRTGTTWQPVNQGLGTLTTTGVAVSLQTSSLMLLSTTSGVFESLDAAKSWHNVSAGLFNANVPSIAVNGGVVFAGTNGDGVYTGQ